MTNYLNINLSRFLLVYTGDVGIIMKAVIIVMST